MKEVGILLQIVKNLKLYNMIILLDSGHGVDTPGKRSPDGVLREYKWCREMTQLVKNKLEVEGYQAIDILNGNEQDLRLSERCAIINNYCKQFGTRNCIAISIHINAAGNDGTWRNAQGWSVFVGNNASNNSKRLAATLYTEAEKAGLKGNRCVPKEKYWVQNLAMCRDTNCPAVLIENMFMDNKQDAAFLLSQEGKEIISNVIVNGIKNYIQTS